MRRADGTLAKSLPDRLETWASYQKSLATPVGDPTFDNQFGDAASKRLASIGREAVEAPPLFDPLYCLCPGACECRPSLGADFAAGGGGGGRSCPTGQGERPRSHTQ